MKYRGESYSNLGSKLKALRNELGITQKELSDGIVTRNMLSRIENGEALPSLSTLSALASRLSVPVGYLIDDHDDGTKLKNDRLLSMIKKEFSSGNYDLCLQYLSGLEYYPEEKELYTARSMYFLGIEKMHSDAPIKEAQRLIADALKNETLLHKYTANEGKAYRALLDGFVFESESGNEEKFISRVANYSSYPCDIALFSSYVDSYTKIEPKELKKIASVFKFGNNAYEEITKGISALVNNEFGSAYSFFIQALNGILPSPIRCYLLTLLERTAVALNEYEKAYSFMSARKELIAKLLKKV